MMRLTNGRPCWRVGHSVAQLGLDLAPQLMPVLLQRPRELGLPQLQPCCQGAVPRHLYIT